MDWLYLIQAAVLGIVEGMTEFLPVSSTGHLIVASDLLKFSESAGADTFVVAIQAGAILAVCWYYRRRIAAVLSGLFSDEVQQRLAINTITGFLPAAVTRHRPIILRARHRRPRYLTLRTAHLRSPQSRIPLEPLTMIQAREKRSQVRWKNRPHHRSSKPNRLPRQRSRHPPRSLRAMCLRIAVRHIPRSMGMFLISPLQS